MTEQKKVELTPEELEILKEIARDRLAMSRVWRLVKNTVLGLSALVVGYLTIVENGMEWLKRHLGL